MQMCNKDHLKQRNIHVVLKLRKKKKKKKDGKIVLIIDWFAQNTTCIQGRMIVTSISNFFVKLYILDVLMFSGKQHEPLDK